MTINFDKIQRIINEFHGEDKRKLIDHYIAVSRNILLDEKEVKKPKVEILQDICSMGLDDELMEDVLDHKILQVRALILDLVDNDYTADCGTVYKPEKWIKQIVRDVTETFDLGTEFGKKLFLLYNQKLLEEFCDIFISENRKFGSSGNQLLLNFYFYRKFVLRKVDVDFEGFFSRMRSSFAKDNFKPEEELEKILNEE